MQAVLVAESRWNGPRRSLRRPLKLGMRFRQLLLKCHVLALSKQHNLQNVLQRPFSKDSCLTRSSHIQTHTSLVVGAHLIMSSAFGMGRRSTYSIA